MDETVASLGTHMELDNALMEILGGQVTVRGLNIRGTPGELRNALSAVAAGEQPRRGPGHRQVSDAARRLAGTLADRIRNAVREHGERLTGITIARERSATSAGHADDGDTHAAAPLTTRRRR